MPSDNAHINSEEKPLFVAIPPEFFNLGLSPYELAAYAWMKRRYGFGHGRKGVYESVSNMAKAAGMSTRRFHTALERLIALGVIRKRGRTSTVTYVLLDKSDWKLPPASARDAQAGEAASARGADALLHEVQNTSARGADKEDTGRRYKEEDTEPPTPLKDSKRKKFDPLTVELPEQVTPEVWSEFVAHRREIRKALTPTATQRLLRNLESFGPAADQALRNSVANGWTGVFAPKDEKPELSRAGNRADARAAQSATDLLTAIRSRKSAG